RHPPADGHRLRLPALEPRAPPQAGTAAGGARAARRSRTGDQAVSDEEKPRRRGFVRRWVRRLTVGFLMLLVVLALAAWGGRIYRGNRGTERLNAVTAKLDADEPGWRLGPLLARHREKAPPPERNSAPVVLKAHLLLPLGWRGGINHAAK